MGRTQKTQKGVIQMRSIKQDERFNIEVTHKELLSLIRRELKMPIGLSGLTGCDVRTVDDVQQAAFFRHLISINLVKNNGVSDERIKLMCKDPGSAFVANGIVIFMEVDSDIKEMLSSALKTLNKRKA